MPGRCAGCGRLNSIRGISAHIVGCEDYLRLYAADPSRCLDPAAEYARFRAEDASPEAKARQRGERLELRFAELNRQQSASADRWATPPDILD